MAEADVTRLPNLTDLTGSLGERVYHSVKDAILELDFPPGAVIRKTSICDWFGLSRSPVSDALSKLAAEGLVDIFPQSGSRVSRLSMQALAGEMFLREALEVAAVRHAALHRTEDTLAQLNRSMEMLTHINTQTDKNYFLKTDLAFHDAIMKTTEVIRLPKTVRSLSQHLDRARRMLVPEPNKLADTFDEHMRILEAIRDKDPNKAQDSMRDHLQQTIRYLEPLETHRPELFSE